MLSRTFTWGIAGVVILCGAWWMLDPVGFSQNPVLSWFKELTLRSRGYHH